MLDCVTKAVFGWGIGLFVLRNTHGRERILGEEFDICVRTGFHCAPFIHDFIDSKKYSGTVRVSFNVFNTKEEIEVLISVLKELS